MTDAGASVEELPPPTAPSLIKLTTLELTADQAEASSKAAGLAALRHPEISAALRSAMHVVGDIATRLPPEAKSRIAERYIHSRIVVDQHTAGAVLYEAYSQSRVRILRNFPGALPPAYESVTALLQRPPSGDGVAYKFNHHGSRVHYVFTTLIGDSLRERRALDWWRNINRLPDLHKLDDLSAGTQWNFISRRAKSLLHLDTADGTCAQHCGKKLWVLVEVREAKRQGIEPLAVDSMRDDPAGTHRLSAWLACDSFQWCVLDEGDTIILPRDRLHAVCCIGDIDAVSSGTYCLLAGTSPLPAHLLPHQKRKRHRSPSPQPTTPPPSPLSIAVRAKETSTSSSSPHHAPIQRIVAATLIDDGQTAASAAAKAATSVSAARRWSKRLRTEPSAEDAARSGRPRKTDALADGAIVRAAELHPFASNREIRARLQLPVSDTTISRRLSAAGLPSHFAAAKPHYTDEQRRSRLSFAHGYKNWTAEQWERVIFSDEVTIEGEGRKRQIRVRRPEGHRFDPEYTLHSRIFTPSRHLFACFCSRGPGFCEMYEGKLDGHALRGLLERTIPETAADYYQTDPRKPGHEQWWLLHDGSPVFNSRVVQTWLHNHAINVLDWPPYSPDLNPIENLWPRVHALMDKLHPTTDEEVADAFVNCWPDLSLDLFTDYAQSMPARIAAVIEANGDATKY
jgi:transposase